MKMVLGSASPRRRIILESMGFDFSVLAPDIDEKATRADDPQVLVLTLAKAKADALIPKLDKATILITSDLVAVFEGKILEKPESKEEARSTLESFGSKPVETVVAVVVTNTQTGKRRQGLDVSKIYFHKFTENLYKEFVDSGLALEHAGSFAAERPMFAPFIKKIEGTLESIAGLPVELTKKLIQEVL